MNVEPFPGHDAMLCLRHERYFLTCVQFDSLWDRSDGVCEVCHDAPASCIEHDHQTLAVRGMVCRSCNARIFFIEERGKTDDRIAEFLSRVPVVGEMPNRRGRPVGMVGIREAAELVGTSCISIGAKWRAHLPEPDGYSSAGRSPWWKPETIRAWRGGTK